MQILLSFSEKQSALLNTGVLYTYGTCRSPATGAGIKSSMCQDINDKPRALTMFQQQLVKHRMYLDTYLYAHNDEMMDMWCYSKDECSIRGGT